MASFLLVLAVANAQIEEYSYDFYIAYGNVVVQNEILFTENQTGLFQISLLRDASALTAYIDGSEAPYTLGEGVITLNLEDSSAVKLSYTTEHPLDDSNFILSLKMPDDVNHFRTSLYLPEGAVLSKPLDKGGVSSGSVFPFPDIMETDGRSIKITWEKSNLQKGEDFSFFAGFKERSNIAFIILFVVFLFIIAFILFLALILRPKKVERVIGEDILEKHLKEDEEQVISILKQREGKCEQGTLRVITGFSKAKLSGLLKEMEERRMIYKEKRGKKNLVFLRE